MKKLLFGLIATVLLSLSVSAQKIGVKQDGKFLVTGDLTFLREKWNQLLKNQNINNEIYDFKIESGVYDDDKEIKYFAIIGFSRDFTVQVAEVIELSSNDEFIYNKALADAGHTVTCNGCMAGCSPQKLKIGWICTVGCYECSKSETVTSR